MPTPLIELFKPGTHTPMAGPRRSFTAADLAAAAKAYDPQLHEAPMVLGHPKDNLPAYGWVKRLEFAGGTLSFEPHQVDPEFAEIVKAGRYKKRSASFYAPNSPENPVPGTYYLRHVGWLGAAPPAVKGLRDASFAAGDGDSIIVIEDLDFAEDDDTPAADRSLLRRFLHALGFSEASLPELPPPAPAPAPAPTPAPPAPEKETPTLPTPEELAAQADDLQKRERTLAAREAAITGTENASFVEGLITAGRLLPAQKDDVLSFMGTLSGTVTVDFTEASKKTTLPQLDFYKRLLEAQPKLVEFKEVAKGDPLEFASPGPGVDRERAELDAKARQHMAANPGMSYIAAVAAVGG